MDTKIFLDSGAFSAFSCGSTINIHDYMDFIKKYEKYVEVYSNLDVIGDAKKTWINQKIMEDKGFKPLPVFHLNDDEKYLHKCLDEYDYFCLGGMAAQGTSSVLRLTFLDKCFSIICDTKDRLPKCKVHGFGMTSIPLMVRYPWYSVDSTSWVLTGRFGSIIVPRIRNKKYDYLNPHKVCVSSRSPSVKDEGQHISNLSEFEKENIIKYINERGLELGKSEIKKVDDKYKLKEGEQWFSRTKGNKEVEIIIEKGITNFYPMRDVLNAIYFDELGSSLPEWPWPFELKTKVKKFGVRK